jgi:hypothetical protein
MQDLGWTSFTFDWLVQSDSAIYCVVIAGIWQSAGFAMALFLAGLRGIDDSLDRRADHQATLQLHATLLVSLEQFLELRLKLVCDLADDFGAEHKRAVWACKGGQRPGMHCDHGCITCRFWCNIDQSVH